MHKDPFLPPWIEKIEKLAAAMLRVSEKTTEKLRTLNLSGSPGGTVSRPAAWLGWLRQRPTARELLVLTSITAFLFFYGLVPIFGGAALGLVGADEPRYAQVAREMLARHDYITPVLYGKPWLEKPALYYWRAMFSFKEFGVHDWVARLPSASFAFTMIVLIYLHMKRFRPGGQLDAALLTASCVGILSFARGASTDMQLAAPFGIGMLGWYAWYETDSKFWLFDLYFFIGAATLAKGPVAPFLALFIILGVRRIAQGVVGASANLLVAGRGAVPGDGSALVYRSAAPQPELPAGFLPTAQFGAICD